MANSKSEVVRLSASTWVGIILVISVPIVAAYVAHERAIAQFGTSMTNMDDRLKRIEAMIDQQRSIP